MVVMILATCYLFNSFFFFFMIISGALWIKFFSNRFSMINNMLLLEIHMMLNFFLMVNLSIGLSGSLTMAFITISVCEAILALGIVIFTSRYKSTQLCQLD